MSDKDFVKKYLNDFSALIRPDDQTIKKIIEVKNLLVQTKKNGNIRCVNFNESDLITCFSNDYGFEKWIEKAIDFYADKGDVLILISSSGKSPNIINACKAARGKKISTIITFTGHEKNNPVSELGDINFWINSKAYNFIENIHQVWLLSIVDLIIGKREYLPS